MPQERPIIANTSDVLVVRNQIGLEISGPNSEFSQTQELIENARNIAFFGRVKSGIEKFADYTGSLGKKISPRNLMLLGGIGITAVAVACGGSEKNADQVSTKPDAPAAPAVVRTIETTSIPAPAVKVEAPRLSPIPIDLAKPILGIQTSFTTIEQVKQSIDDVYTKYPNLVYTSQGISVDKDRVASVMNYCENGGPGSIKVPVDLPICGDLVRIFYQGYINTGHEGLYQNAVDVYSWVLTQRPDDKEAFLKQVQRSLGFNKLLPPAK